MSIHPLDCFRLHRYCSNSQPNDCVYPEPNDYAQDKRSRWAQGDAVNSHLTMQPELILHPLHPLQNPLPNFLQLYELNIEN